MTATETIVLYDDISVIAEVYAGEQYFIPDNVSIFTGTIDEFKIKFPNILITIFTS